MQLPEEIEQKINELLGMPDFDMQERKKYKERTDGLRQGMRQITHGFAVMNKNAGAYGDAYFAFNFPQNYMKAAAIAGRIAQTYPGLLKRNDFRILDVGCGEGAGMFGLYGYLRKISPSARFSITGIDMSGPMLARSAEIGRWLNEENGDLELNLTRHRVGVNLFRHMAQKYDIVLFANSLAEIVEGDRLPGRFFETALGLLEDRGILIIIEPALKSYTRRLMLAREMILRRRTGNIMLPCLHDNECPLLKIEKEWCHASVKWIPTALVKLLNEKLNREIDYLKFSYLVVSRDVKACYPHGYFLVISHLLTEKGRKRCYICTPEGRVELVRQERSRSAANVDFDQILKGGAVSVKSFLKNGTGKWKVTETTEIDLINTWYGQKTDTQA